MQLSKLVEIARNPFSLSALIGLMLALVSVYMGNQYLKQAYFDRVTDTAMVTAKGVNNLITEKFEQNKLVSRSIVNHHKDRILELAYGAGYPYDFNQISAEIEALFSDIRQFAILDEFGHAVIGSEGYFLGGSCHHHINRSILEKSTETDEELHRCAHGSHYDVIVKVSRGDRQASFYVSYYLTYLQNLLAQFGSAEIRLLLVDGKQPSEVMLTPNAVASDQPLYKLSKVELAQVLSSVQITSNDWHIIALPAKGLFEAYSQKIDFASWSLLSGVLILYFGFLFFLHKANTARFEAEQKATYNSLFNAGPTVLIEKALERASLDYVSPNVQQLLGFSGDEMLSRQSFYELIYAEDLTKFKNAVKTAVRNKVSSFEIELRIMRQDYQYIWVYGLMHLQFDHRDQAQKMQGYLTSIHEQKVAEKQATALIESAPDAILITSEQGTVLQANNMVQALFGYELEFVVGQSVNKLLPMFQRELAQLKRVDNTEQKEYEGLTQSGAVLSLSLRLNRLYTSQGWVVTIFIRDISLQKQAQQQMQQAKEHAERLAESRTRFMAMVSHEIRTPMNGVLGMADLLSTTSLNTTQRNYVEVIQQSGGSLVSILNDVLDFSKLDEGKIQLQTEPFDLKAVVDNCFKLLTPQARLAQVTLSKHYDTQQTLLWLNGDAVRLRQIILNFLGNAIKFSPNGQVCLDVQLEAMEKGRVMLQLVFKDNGIGISKKDQKSLFEAYTQADSSFSRNFGGTGLGLSISKQLIDLMDGSVSVESSLSKGSVFKVRIPFELVDQVDAGQQPETEEDEADSTLPALRALLVEDDLVNQQIAEAYLKKLGLEVDTVHNGLEAVEYWRMHHDSLDLVIMDCQMPVMDGFESSRMIRHEEQLMDKEKRTVIIAFTADAYAAEQQAIEESDLDDFLIKPLQPKEFNAKLTPWLERIREAKAKA